VEPGVYLTLEQRVAPHAAAGSHTLKAMLNCGAGLRVADCCGLEGRALQNEN
jgi:hypothetical protein